MLNSYLMQGVNTNKNEKKTTITPARCQINELQRGVGQEIAEMCE